MTRYDRHNLIDWFDQQRVREARIVVVGAGAIGNEVLKSLALLGVGHISIFDFDRIEDHNLTRSVLFRESDVGRSKAEAAAAACSQIDPGITCEAHCADFWDALRLDDLAEADAAICCVDNFEARQRINQLCMMTATDLCNTGIDSRFASAELFPFASDQPCACIECGWPDSVYEAIGRRYTCGVLRRVGLKERKVPTTAVTSSMAGAMAVSMVLNRLHAHPHAPSGSFRCFTDTISFNSVRSELPQNADCPACTRHTRRVERMSAQRHCALSPAIRCAVEGEVEMVLSEPVLLTTTCRLCGAGSEHYESVRRKTAAVAVCATCHEQSAEAAFAERLALPDFERTFAGRRVPCKFVTCVSGTHEIVIEMEN